MIQKDSVGSQILYSWFPKPKIGKKYQAERSVSSKFSDIWTSLTPICLYGKMWQVQRDDMNSNKAFTKQKTKTQKDFWKSVRIFFSAPFQ